MPRTLVPTLDHLTDADLCNKSHISGQRKMSVSARIVNDAYTYRSRLESNFFPSVSVPT